MIERERDSETLFLLKANQDPASYRIVVISFQFCSRGTLPLLTTSLGRQRQWMGDAYLQVDLQNARYRTFQLFFSSRVRNSEQRAKEILGLFSKTLFIFCQTLLIFSQCFNFLVLLPIIPHKITIKIRKTLVLFFISDPDTFPGKNNHKKMYGNCMVTV